MIGKCSILVATVLMLLAGSFSLLGVAEGSEPAARAPMLKQGHITSNEDWTENISGYALRNVVIDAGVTVTVGPGVPLWFFEDSFLYVNGSLIVNGLKGDEVQFKSLTPGTYWGEFDVNTTGYVHMENFTLLDRGNLISVGITLYSKDCVLKNGEVHGGFQNILLQSEGGHLIENMVLYGPQNFGISLYINDEMTTVRNVVVNDPRAGAIAAVSSNGTFEGIQCHNSSQSGIWFWSGCRNIVLKDFWVTWPEFKNNEAGIVFNPNCSGIEIENGIIENCRDGIYFSPSEDYPLDATFREVWVESSVKSSIIAQSLGRLDAVFTDCTLMGTDRTISIDGTNGHQAVEFVNTTWNPIAPLEVLSGAYLNISWHLDAKVKDGNGFGLNTTLKVFHSDNSTPDEVLLSYGTLKDLPVGYANIQGGLPTEYLYHDLQFQPIDHPGDTYDISDRSFTGYTYWGISLDLKPTNDLPDNIHIDEDDWYEMDLYDHFIDPEGKPLEFLINHSDTILVTQTGGKSSGDVRIRNKEPEWSGTGWANITATDTGGNQTYRNVTIVVDAINDPPRFIDPYPIKTIEEETWTFFNFSGNIVDVEGDDPELKVVERDQYTFEYNSTTMNLTVWPEPDFFGMLKVEVNLSDGNAWSIEQLMVNVTPVNDAPSVVVRLKDGSAVKLIEWDTPGLMAFDVNLVEDTPVGFWLDASDVDSTNLTYSFLEEDLLHGTIEHEAYEIENGTGIVPMNFTYIPAPDDNTGDDLVRFMVGDGENSTTVRVWFNVTPVNDPIEFDAPSDWNASVYLNIALTIDIGAWIEDIDGDAPIITTTSDFINVTGTVMTLLYSDSFIGTSETVTVTVSDGPTQVTAILLVTVDREAATLGRPKVTGKGDEWVVEVSGSEGQDLWVVVEDDEGNKRSYKMTYDDGKYTAVIPKDEAEEGFEFWISRSEDGDPINGSMTGDLPSIKEKKDDNDLCFICCGATMALLLVAFILLIIIGIASAARKKGKDISEE